MTATNRWRGVGSPMFWRLFIASATIVVAVLALVLTVLGSSAYSTARDSVDRGLVETRRLAAALLESRERAMTSAAVVFAQGPVFRALVLEQRPEDLLDQAEEAAQRTGASWAQITNGDGVRLAKSDEPTALPVELSGTALIGRALAGEPAFGIGVAGDTAIFQGVAVPIQGGSAVAGTLMLTQLIDSSLANEIRDATASEVVFFLLDAEGFARAAAGTIEPGEELMAILHERAAAPSAASEPEAGDADPRGAVARRDNPVVRIGGDEYVASVDLLHSASGEPLGGFATLRSLDVAMAPFTILRSRILLSGGLGLSLAFILSFVMARSITRPILELTEAARRAAAGDYAVDGVRARAGDELGMLAEAVRTMLTGMRERDVLATLAREVTGDFPVAPPSIPPGQALRPNAVVAGRYRILYHLGVGGGGIVYKAVDEELGEPVALKMLRTDVLGRSDEALERLRSEIRLARRITHPNVVRIHDIGESDGRGFITMEFVAGASLDRLLAQRGALAVDATLSIGRQLCRALEVAHAQGIIHRDIKPQNLMVQPDGVLKVMDFGVARLLRRSTVLTEQGAVVGTPAYMAPEQLLDEAVDQRADIYASGVVLFECAAGRRPLEGSTPTALIGRILTETPPPLASVAPGTPPALSEVIARALERDPARRPASATELLNLLVAVEVASV